MQRQFTLPETKRRRTPRPRNRTPSPPQIQQIQSLVNRIAQEISPQRIILFGSHAQGEAGPESDVDLLVVTDRPAGSDASLALRRKVDYSFPLDLIVCDARRLVQRIEAGDFFLHDAVRLGKVLYERPDR